MPSVVGEANHLQQQQQQQQQQQSQQQRTTGIMATAQSSSTSVNHNSATATAAQAAAACAAAGRDMKNFSDHEINELLGLIPDEYTAEEQQQQADEAAAAAAAANAAAALGKGVHHSVVGTTTACNLASSSGSGGGIGGIRRLSAQGETQPNTILSGQQQQQQKPGIVTATATSNNGNEDTKNMTSMELHIAQQEAQVRSERKRSREKQRRNDVNKQFQELTEVLKQIEREAQEMGRGDDSYGSLSTMMAIAASTGPTNRVDLIARTIVHLERLNRTAKKQKIEINQLRDQLENTKKSGEDMAEKLKDVMFNQQRHVMSGFSPYPHMMSSVQQQGTMNNNGAVTCGGTIPGQGAQQVGMRSVATTNGTTTTTNGVQHHQQQQMPMMMMPMMM